MPQALQWYEQLENRHQILHLLETHVGDDKFWGFGGKDSPHRNYLLGYVALNLGQVDKARDYFDRVIRSKKYVHLFSTVDGALSRAL
jgi:hypothetical protein